MPARQRFNRQKHDTRSGKSARRERREERRLAKHLVQRQATGSGRPGFAASFGQEIVGGMAEWRPSHKRMKLGPSAAA
jgi:hypothetical protein